MSTQTNQPVTKAGASVVDRLVLSSASISGSDLVFKFSDGTTQSVSFQHLIDSLKPSIDAAVSAAVSARLPHIARVNPSAAQEKDGDIRVSGSTIHLRRNGQWVQAFPPTWQARPHL